MLLLTPNETLSINLQTFLLVVLPKFIIMIDTDGLYLENGYLPRAVQDHK